MYNVLDKEWEQSRLYKYRYTMYIFYLSVYAEVQFQRNSVNPLILHIHIWGNNYDIEIEDEPEWKAKFNGTKYGKLSEPFIEKETIDTIILDSIATPILQRFMDGKMEGWIPK